MLNILLQFFYLILVNLFFETIVHKNKIKYLKREHTQVTICHKSAHV